MRSFMHRIGIGTIIILSTSTFLEAGHCWQIKNKDMKAYCEASVYGKKSCWQIKEKDLQMMCKAEMGSK